MSLAEIKRAAPPQHSYATQHNRNTVAGVMPLASFEERTFDLGEGGSLHYRACGSGPPILLVHGLGGTSLNWAAVAPRLVATGRVLVPDLPGHGKSTAPGSLASLEPFAEALVALVEHEQAAPVPVVGHSLGGLVGVRLAVRRPEAVAGIVLCAPAGISSTRPFARYAIEVLGVLRPGRRLVPHRRRIAASPRLRAATFAWWGASDAAMLSAETVEGFLAGWEHHTDTISAARAMVLDDVRTDLVQVACPCIVLWGARDHQVGIADGFDYARRLGAPLRAIPDCGHLLIGERPDAVLDAVDQLLDRIRELQEVPLEAKALG
jgi:pimeloyl-ACP methyl ester carboxylesterase